MKAQTRLKKLFMGFLASDSFRELRQFRGSIRRRLTGTVPEVHYFHQVDDPYSHLAVQKLDDLQASYDVQFKVHLVP